MSNKHELDLDNELAELTNMLMEGKKGQVSAENEEYGQVVRDLYQLMTREQPSSTYRAKLTRRLNEEWETVFRQAPTRNRFSIFAGNNRIMAFAAVIILALLFVLIMLPQISIVQSGSGVGTATGLTGNIVAPIIIVGIVLVAVGVFLFRRR